MKRKATIISGVPRSENGQIKGMRDESRKQKDDAEKTMGHALCVMYVDTSQNVILTFSQHVNSISFFHFHFHFFFIFTFTSYVFHFLFASFNDAEREFIF